MVELAEKPRVYDSQRYAIGMAAVGTVVIAVGVGFRQGFDFSWVGLWWVWIILAFWGLGFYGIFRKVGAAAGADWLKVGRIWVLLYELTEIKVRHRGMSMHLNLKDSGNRSLQVRVDELQEDRDLWDLVYNGLLHSAAVNGAKTNWAAHSLLEVPDPE